jgi:hypothetical protein
MWIAHPFDAGLTAERMTYVRVTEWRSRNRDPFHHMPCIRLWGVKELTVHLVVRDTVAKYGNIQITNIGLC